MTSSPYDSYGTLPLSTKYHTCFVKHQKSCSQLSDIECSFHARVNCATNPIVRLLAVTLCTLWFSFSFTCQRSTLIKVTVSPQNRVEFSMAENYRPQKYTNFYWNFVHPKTCPTTFFMDILRTDCSVELYISVVKHIAVVSLYQSSVRTITLISIYVRRDIVNVENRDNKTKSTHIISV